MVFNHRAFFKAMRLSLIDQPFTLRRWLYVIGFSGLYLTFIVLVGFARQIDLWLWPNIRRTAIEAPVFIIAPPRSGTSYLQRLLAADENRFVYWRLYQTILPSVGLERLIRGVGAWDLRFGRRVSKGLERLQSLCFGGWDGLHTMRLSDPEEDGALYLYAFACEAIYMLFPFVEELWELGFPDSMPEPRRLSLMAYYRSCLQRLVFGSGPGKTVLIKSTNSSGTIASILREFPDARIITIVRDPAQSIASSISLMMPAIKSHSPEISERGPVSQNYAKLSAAWYKHLHANTRSLPPDRCHVVSYPALISHPAETVLAIYQSFGWKPSGEFRLALTRQVQKESGFSSHHRYELEDFGVSRAWLYQELAAVLYPHGLMPETLSQSG